MAFKQLAVKGGRTVDMKRGWKYTFLMFVGFVLMASISPASTLAEETVKIGIVLPLTGAMTKPGAIQKQSFQMAMEEIKETGGINGKRLEFLIEDDKYEPEEGQLVVKRLITMHKVVMIGGGFSSSVTYAAAQVAQQRGVPFLVNTASADKITEQGWDYIFRLNPPASEYASGLESFLAEVVKPKSAVILQEKAPSGNRGAEFFKKSCDKLGIKVLTTEVYMPGNTDLKQILIKVKQMNSDIVFMISSLEGGVLIMRESREKKLSPKLFIGGAAGFALPEFAQKAGKASEKLVLPTLWHQLLPLPGVKDYFNKFKARYNIETSYHGAQAYAAAQVIVDAVKRSRSLKPDDIKQALKQTDMMTVLGPVKFTSYGKKSNQNKLTTYVVQWQDGELKLIWPRNLANAKYVFPVNWLKEWGN
jgi:branched-chain amino acid transport system substrate-binding protein